MNFRQLLIKTTKDLRNKRSFRYTLFIMAGLLIGAFIGIIYFTGILAEQKQITTLDNFIIKEGSQDIRFFDREGNEILIIDNR